LITVQEWSRRGQGAIDVKRVLLTILCNCGGHNALNKSTLIFKCPYIVVWFGNLPPPFILPPPFGILNGGGRILNGGG
jgi:hypothetical protein